MKYQLISDGEVLASSNETEELIEHLKGCLDWENADYDPNFWRGDVYNGGQGLRFEIVEVAEEL